MEDQYIEYSFQIQPLRPASEILIAELGELGFESFVETSDGLLAYIQKKHWHEKILETVRVLTQKEFNIHFNVKTIAQENWNARWESNFKPIRVGDACEVRAPFHNSHQLKYDIVIEPKMSFGTGHHETTHMMLEQLLTEDIKDAVVLDMGCGTGVLAILAAMKGASRIDAIDKDHWSYLNALENVARNGQNHIRVLEGDVTLLAAVKYDLILANINRNVLLNDIPVYAQCLNENGVLMLSGFYSEDLFAISEKCAVYDLKIEKNLLKNNWVAAKYVF